MCAMSRSTLIGCAFATAITAIGQPTPLSPCGPGPLYDPATTIQFVWSNSAGAVQYQLQVSQDPGYSFTAVDITTPSTFHDVFAVLFFDAHYFWRVRANNGAVWSAWSSNCDFQTMPMPPPPAPVLQVPANGAVNLSTSVGLQWSFIPATAIEIHVSSTAGFTSPTIVNTSGQQHTLNGLLNGQTYYWRVRGSNIGGTGPWSEVWTFTTASVATTLNLRMYLQGPWNTGTGRMNDALRLAGLVPTAEPYTALGFTGLSNAGASIAGGVLSVAGPNAVVDWVLIEARHATANTILARWAALLQCDGDVALPNGNVPSLVFPMGQVRIAVRHRTHLGCMATAVRNANGTAIDVDLTLLTTVLYGTEPTTTVSGFRALWAGDVSTNGIIAYSGGGNDRDRVLSRIGGIVPTNTATGYHLEDANLDGVVMYSGPANDRDIILQTIGGVVPTQTRSAQLP